MGDGNSEMGFWDHVEALRGTLLRCVAALAVAAIAAFAVMPWVFDNVVLAPCRSDFATYRLMDLLSGNGAAVTAQPRMQVELININLTSQFMIHMWSSLWLALLLTAPLLLWEVWRFVAPALYANERRGVAAATAMGAVMFYLGVAMAYFVAFPLTMRFLADYRLSSAVPNVVSLDSYVDMFSGLCMWMGVVFELPVVAWLLGRLGLLTRRVFTRYRRHAIVALLVLAAFITPTGDAMTLAVVFVPLYLLWEASAWLVPQRSEQQS